MTDERDGSTARSPTFCCNLVDGRWTCVAFVRAWLILCRQSCCSGLFCGKSWDKTASQPADVRRGYNTVLFTFRGCCREMMAFISREEGTTVQRSFFVCALLSFCGHRFVCRVLFLFLFYSSIGL